MIPELKIETLAMKSFQHDSYITHCGTLSEWDSLKAKFKGEAKVSVIDLRTSREREEGKMEDIPDEWVYRRLPLNGHIVSEQDIDVFRREQRRHGRLLVVAPNEVRGSLLCLIDSARIARKDMPQDQLEILAARKLEPELTTWLEGYAKRHKSTDLDPLVVEAEY